MLDKKSTLASATELANNCKVRYPNENAEYRRARTALLAEEIELRRHIERVAEMRRALPPGGEVKDYRFIGEQGPVDLADLFGDKQTLVTYSFMYGPHWDNPCPSCTSLVDGFDRTAYQVTRDAAFAVIAKAPVEMINAWARRKRLMR